MNSAFSSWSDFFAMGGYAFYVWLAVFFTAIPLAALIVYTLLQKRTILRQVARQQARERRIRTATDTVEEN